MSPPSPRPRRGPGPQPGSAPGEQTAPGGRAGGQTVPGEQTAPAGRAAAGRPAAGRAAAQRLAGARGLAQPHVRRPVFFAAAVLAIVAGAAWALLGSKVLVVRSVRVVGSDSLVPRARVLAAAGLPSGLPMLRVSPGSVARQVERRITDVQWARVTRDWPDTVVITVRPRTAVFAVGTRGNYQLVDAYGVTVRRSARQPRQLPSLTLGGRGSGITRGDGPAVRAAAVVLGELPRRIARQVRSVAAPSAMDVSVRLADGVVIVWGDTGRPAEKARELAVLLRTHAHLYDVSAPGTVVTR